VLVDTKSDLFSCTFLPVSKARTNKLCILRQCKYIKEEKLIPIFWTLQRFQWKIGIYFNLPCIYESFILFYKNKFQFSIETFVKSRRLVLAHPPLYKAPDMILITIFNFCLYIIIKWINMHWSLHVCRIPTNYFLHIKFDIIKP
jgi:hypothetical protein